MSVARSKHACRREQNNLTSLPMSIRHGPHAGTPQKDRTLRTLGSCSACETPTLALASYQVFVSQRPLPGAFTALTAALSWIFASTL